MTLFFDALSSRSTRERWLVYTAFILCVLLSFWQFGLKPVLDNKARAEKSFITAQRDLDIVKLGLPKLGQGASDISSRAKFDRPALIEVARNAEVPITRVQPTGESLQVWFEEAETAAVYKLMSDLSAQYNVVIERVQITRRESGRVSAQIKMKPGS